MYSRIFTQTSFPANLIKKHKKPRFFLEAGFLLLSGVYFLSHQTRVY